MESSFFIITDFPIVHDKILRSICHDVASIRYIFQRDTFPHDVTGPTIGSVPHTIVESSSIASCTLLDASPLVPLSYHTSCASWSGVGTRTAIVPFIA